MLEEINWEYRGRITVRDTRDFRVTTTLRSVRVMSEYGDFATRTEYKTYKWKPCIIVGPDHDGLPIVRKPK